MKFNSLWNCKKRQDRAKLKIMEGQNLLYVEIVRRRQATASNSADDVLFDSFVFGWDSSDITKKQKYMLKWQIKLTFFSFFLEKSEGAWDWNDDTKCVKNKQRLEQRLSVDQLSCLAWLFSWEIVSFQHFEAKIYFVLRSFPLKRRL